MSAIDPSKAMLAPGPAPRLALVIASWAPVAASAVRLAEKAVDAIVPLLPDICRAVVAVAEIYVDADKPKRRRRRKKK